MADVSSADFKTRIPSFKDVPDETVQLFLDEAVGEIPSDWSEGDRMLGTMFLAAHKMTSEGIGGSAESQFGTFKRLKIGSLELERATSSSDAPTGSLAATSYGQKYLGLFQANGSFILVV